jgi:twitching motility protein PilT
VAGLGELLVGQGVLTAEQLQQAEAHLAERGGNLAGTLVELRMATEGDLVRAYATSIGMAYAEVDGANVDPHAAGLLSPATAHELTALPVRFGNGDEIVVAIADPTARDALAPRLQHEIGLPVSFALAPRRALQEAIAAVAAEQPTAPVEEPEPVRAPLHAVAAPEPVAAAPAPAPAAPVANGNGHVNGNGDHNGGVGTAPFTPPTSSPFAPPTALSPEAAAVRGAAVSRETEATLGHNEPTVMSEEAASIDLDELLITLVERGGSDLHLTVGIPPAIRVNGELTHLDEFAVCEPDDLRKMLYAIMTQKQREAFENDLELDMSYAIPGRARFRVNIFQQRDAIGSVMRVIPFEIKPLEQLGIPEQVSNFAYLPRGFVLVTGPTGSGKSTTLASLVDLVNRNRASHIMTVEDPIEFLHHHKRSVVNQREVGTDTHGFTQALKHVLRQDPDVILVGEMRDLETIQIALTAAETGHLVFGTLHTQDAPQSIDRIIDVFPPHQQEQIRVMLAGALKGVVCQTLIKTADNKGRIAACEVMVANSGIRNLIREGKTHQIYSAIQAGAKDGMIAMDQSLALLVKAGKITYDSALEKCSQVNEFNRLVGRA